MQTDPSSPVLDPARLTALDEYSILDTLPEQGFEDIVRLATRLCATPVALVSLVAADRQWFKARVGFPQCETDLDRSVCKFALPESDLLVIPDLTADPRTAANPLVTDDPHIRFYAGAPLRSPEGHVLGSLCVIDTAPRPAGLTGEQAADLRALARQVTDLLSLRRTVGRLAESEKRYRSLFDNIDEGFCVVRFVDGPHGPMSDYVHVEANPAFEHHLGIPFVIGQTLRDIVADDPEEWLETYLEVWRTGETVRFERAFKPNGRRLEVSVHRVDPATRREVAVLFSDISDRHAAQDALKRSEAHWRGLFENLSEGFVVGEAVRDAAGTIRDWRYVDVNAAWGELVSVDPATVIGRTIREVIPGIEDAWVAEFADVIETGEPVTFTRQVGTLGRWYEGRAFPLGAERFGVIFLEITDRVQAEARRSSLIELGDRLRDLDDVEEMTHVTCGILGRTLDAMLVGYGDVDPYRETVTVGRDWTTGGAETLAGTLNFRDYGSYIDDLKRGETVVVRDCRADPRTRGNAAALEGRSARAFVNAPVFERGAFVALLFVCTGHARDWTKPELAFIRDVGSRLRLAVARVRAEERQDILNHELSHRLKNTLAVVQSIAGQTLRSVTEREPVEAFERRILALSRAHDVLLQDAWAPASLPAVAAGVLGPHAAMDRFVLSGPEMGLAPSAVLSLSLLLHELATNAAKYGSLSVEGGHVELSWSVATGTEPVLEMRWLERGGPPAAEPSRRGFGTRLIRSGLVGTRDADLDYGPDGLAAVFRAPLTQVGAS